MPNEQESYPKPEVFENVDKVVIGEKDCNVTIFYNDGKCIILTPIVTRSKIGCRSRLEKSYGGRIGDFRPKKT